MLIRSLFLKDSYPIAAIGSTTKGQTVATEQFINEEFRWSVNPVVCTVYNSTHDDWGAISPNDKLKVSETSIDGVIEGTYPPKEEDKGDKTKAQFKIEKSVSSPASRRFTGGTGLRIK